MNCISCPMIREIFICCESTVQIPGYSEKWWRKEEEEGKQWRSIQVL